MKTELAWVSELVPLTIDTTKQVDKLVNDISLTSVEIDDVVSIAGKQSGLSVVEIKSVSSHPNSEHLQIIEVDDGTNNLKKIVSGAPNIELGQKAILASAGAKIIKEGQLVEIKPATLKGIESRGMLVSLQEINFSNQIAPKKHEEGIYVFPSDSNVQIGEDALSALGARNIVLETGLTPNRADMLSIIGVAHEIASMYNLEVKLPEIDLPFDESTSTTSFQTEVDVKLSKHYLLRNVQQVQIDQSPLWIQKKLWNSGIRPINNIVDITNLTMLLYGQPLHAFDADKIVGDTIRVRNANESEMLVTLDGEKRELRTSDIVIADESGPIALAGVMGGLATEVTFKTKNILLESAVFDSNSIRATAQHFNLHSEASSRFERGINLDTILMALNYAASLMKKYGNGKLSKQLIVGSDEPIEENKVSISTQKINSVLGTSLSVDEISKTLNKLHFEIEKNGGEFNISIPNRRWDIKIPEDIIEEVARLYGYDNLPSEMLPQINTAKLSTKQLLTRKIKTILLGFGIEQTNNYSLTDEEKAKLFAEDQSALVNVMHPMTQERTTLRQSLLPGLLETASYNQARQQLDLQLFEIGKVFFGNSQTDKLPNETTLVSAIFTGNRYEKNWVSVDKNIDFFHVKGLVESLLSEIQINQPLIFEPIDEKQYIAFHPGQTARIKVGNQLIGFVGKIHPQVTEKSRLTDTFFFELKFDSLFQQIKNDKKYEMPSKFPSTSRDLSLLVERDISASQLQEIIQSFGGPLLSKVIVFDVYQGEKIPKEKKSINYSLTFTDKKQTLIEENIDQLMKNIESALVEQLQVTVR